MRALLFIFLSFSCLTQSNLQLNVNSFTQYWAFKNAGISICIADTDSGEFLATHNKDLALPPASTVKLFSTATALEVLTPTYRATTKIYLDGEIIAGVLNGNVVIRGGGDPSLGSHYFTPENQEQTFLETWTVDLKKLGIKKIEGQIIVDGSEFGYQGAPDGWSWGDLGNYYGAGPSGVVIYDNMLKYYFKTGDVGQAAQLIKTFPALGQLNFSNQITVSSRSGDNSYLYGAPFCYERSGIGTLPANRSEFIVKGSLPDPEWQLASDFTAQLSKDSISVSNGFRSVRYMLLNNEKAPSYEYKLPKFQYVGEYVSNIVYHTNMKSVNLFAEQLLCLVGYKLTGNGSTEKGLEQLEKYWKEKIDFIGLNLKDGSGLSRNNAVSSEHFCLLLNQMRKSTHFDSFYRSLPVAGQSGTLSNVCTGEAAQGRVHAKSGTMNKIKSYSGYVNTKSGRKLSFAIVLNNFNCSNQAALAKIEELFNAMANL
jgi:D-alanyl-D-alanine carboxypeptidase/D-alanyl-D-alanine-endopeptidase (penicillin-binding protein 4)